MRSRISTAMIGVVAAALVAGFAAPARAAAVDTTPPSAPSALRAEVSGDTVTLTWTASTDSGGGVEYDIHTWSEPGFIPDDESLYDVAVGTTYVDTAVPAGRWYYRVVAVDEAGNESAPSGEAGVVVPDVVAPSAPGSVTSARGTSTINVTWTAATDNVGVTTYDVYRAAATASSTLTLLGSVSGLTFADTPAEGTWYYHVAARDAAGNRSATAFAPALNVQLPRAPGAPTNLTATAGERGTVLRWLTTDPGYPNAHSYVVTISPGGQQITSLGNFVNVFSLMTGTTYTFSVYAKNSVGPSPTATSAPFVGKGFGGVPAAAPPAVTGLLVKPGPGRAVLSWSNPAEIGSGIVVQRAHADVVGGPEKVVEFYRGTGTTATATGLVDGKTYRFTVYRIDETPTSSPVQSTLYGSALAHARNTSRIVTGGTVRHTARLTRAGAAVLLAGKSVALYARTAGTRTWSIACSRTTVPTAPMAYCPTKPTRNTEYEWRFAGFGDQSSTTSKRYVVRVQPKVTATASARSVPRGSSFRLTGAVAPRHAGQAVYLQRYSAGAWRTIARRSLTTTSRYTFRVTPRSTYSYRIYKTGDGDHSYGISPTRRVSVG